MYIEIDFNSDEAIYQQLCNQIIYGIATSQYEEGQTLPSVRELADEIGINMHTVNKAYSLLREQGFVKVDRRRGAVISVDDNRDRALEVIRKEIVPILAESYSRGVPRQTVHDLVDEIYNAYEGYGTDSNPKA
ncbi:MAG: GntR family transcriptional regulator [Lachnospiraceae bacterium]|jgi:DNA-binding transcriptional regulator YhcF (GntR family)|nr:GntR family transcriptional regulator [Lachnospiraceae bacterium]MCI1397742.1 GntR family transcriptional regulator [Lachnospiraceae bacterium]MCI1423356.1 GntR family transcriptional regulator [Lachnospiraceae bacterium]MCI1452227.1 GntR family transcriptional regulator [Lachnospiraceae bacterium]MDD5850007.1 GntR family transcriptional regulator [Bacillota bacterium]